MEHVGGCRTAFFASAGERLGRREPARPAAYFHNKPICYAS